MPFYRETALSDAVYFVLERMEEVEGKRVIFLLASGMDTISRHSYSETLKKAEASDTVIYSVGMAQFARSMEVSPQDADYFICSLAESTGGLSFFPRVPGEYSGIYETVNADMRHQYMLSFISTNPKLDGKLRKLKVEVAGTDINGDGKPDKLKVRHKKEYYARITPTSEDGRE
ncbi:MAG: hypothetical protein HY646_19495 [Acidobacteria bacterium]|nr:hypothetical protein [Acidobacteriota bacterium]